MDKGKNLLGILRIGLGWIFLWAFIDKLFGFGFTTARDASWIAGTSPTYGFLAFGTKGPFAEIFKTMAGNPVVDWLYMLGVLFIGLALIFGIGMKIAGYAGALMTALMYLAGFIPPEHNPFWDEHLMYVVLFLLFAVMSDSGKYLGFGNWWQNTRLVQKYPILK